MGRVRLQAGPPWGVTLPRHVMIILSYCQKWSQPRDVTQSLFEPYLCQRITQISTSSLSGIRLLMEEAGETEALRVSFASIAYWWPWE